MSDDNETEKRKGKGKGKGKEAIEAKATTLTHEVLNVKGFPRLPFDLDQIIVTHMDSNTITVRAWHGLRMEPLMLRIYRTCENQKGNYLRETLAYDRINRGERTWEDALATRNHEFFARMAGQNEGYNLHANFTPQKIVMVKEYVSSQSAMWLPSKFSVWPEIVSSRGPVAWMTGKNYLHQWLVGPNDWVPLTILHHSRADMVDEHWGMIMSEVANHVLWMHRERQVVHRAISARNILVDPIILEKGLGGVRVMLVNFEMALVPPIEEYIAKEAYGCGSAMAAQFVWNRAKKADCEAVLSVCSDLRWEDPDLRRANIQALRAQLGEY